MVYGVISDIHGNLEALEAVLHALAEAEAEAFICLGDIVGYGPDPGACVDRVRELPGLVCLAGNHDLAAVGRYELAWFNPVARAAIEWTAGRLSPGQREFLSSLRPVGEAGGAALAHGSLGPDPMAYILSPREAAASLEAMPGSLAFVGHTHVAECYLLARNPPHCRHRPWREGGRLELEAGQRALVNPGAVGQPRDGNPQASFALWDTEEGGVEVRRVAYDIEAVQAKMKEQGLPGPLIVRLAIGR